MASQKEWDKRYLSVANLVSDWSTCLRRKVGCIIVKNGRIVATGYNGAPSGVTTCKELGRCSRENVPSGERQELCIAAHAEQNALIQAASLGISVQGCDMYCTHKPCSICFKLILNAGIKNIIYENDYPDELTMSLAKMSNTTKLIKFDDTEFEFSPRRKFNNSSIFNNEWCQTCEAYSKMTPDTIEGIICKDCKNCSIFKGVK